MVKAYDKRERSGEMAAARRRTMTSGPIPLDRDPDEVLEALRKAVSDNSALLGRPAEEGAKELVRGGYLEEEPDPVLVAEMLGVVEAEEGRP